MELIKQKFIILLCQVSFSQPLKTLCDGVCTSGKWLVMAWKRDLLFVNPLLGFGQINGWTWAAASIKRKAQFRMEKRIYECSFEKPHLQRWNQSIMALIGVLLLIYIFKVQSSDTAKVAHILWFEDNLFRILLQRNIDFLFVGFTTVWLAIAMLLNFTVISTSISGWYFDLGIELNTSNTKS